MTASGELRLWITTLRFSLKAGELFAEVGVVAGDPVLAGWGEDVEVDGVFEGFGGVREIGGYDEDLSGADVFGDLWGAVFAEDETERAFEDVSDLLVGVGVARDDAAFFEDDAGEHSLGAGDELAGEKRVELLGWDVVPGDVLKAFAHGVSLQVCWREGECVVN
jgi:hypothetical protein